jgi:hypothetical protein
MFQLDYYTHTIMKFCSSRPGKVIYSVLAGSMGALILVLFLTGMSLVAAIGDLLPVIIGFNTALTGYMVLEKTRQAFIHKRIVAICSGVTVVLVTAFLLNILSFRGAGIYLINTDQLMTLLGIGIITSGLGGMLAIKYFNLNNKN